MSLVNAFTHSHSLDTQENLQATDRVKKTVRRRILKEDITEIELNGKLHDFKHSNNTKYK
jgi:hypothetical protein